MLTLVILIALLNLASGSKNSYGDLLDLYVQHMDEIMKVPEFSTPSRIPRSVIESQYYSAADVVSQKLDRFSGKLPRKDRGRKPPTYFWPRETDLSTKGDLGVDLADGNDLDPVKRLAKRSVPFQRKIRGKKHRKRRPFRKRKNHGKKGKKFSKKRKPLPIKAEDEDDSSEVPLSRNRRQIDENNNNNNSTSSEVDHSREQMVHNATEIIDAKVQFLRREHLDEDGDVVLEWDPRDEEIVTFRVTAKTLGYVSLGFNDRSSLKGADILMAWVDDATGAANVVVKKL